MSQSPKCYSCKHRRNISGDAHSQCIHPATGNEGDDLVGGLMTMIGNVMSDKGIPGAAELRIKGNAHGIEQGWFYWPFNYDPVWLENCDGYEAREAS